MSSRAGHSQGADESSHRSVADRKQRGAGAARVFALAALAVCVVVAGMWVLSSESMQAQVHSTLSTAPSLLSFGFSDTDMDVVKARAVLGQDKDAPEEDEEGGDAAGDAEIAAAVQAAEAQAPKEEAPVTAPAPPPVAILGPDSRRFAPEGCNFSRCVPAGSRIYNVGGRSMDHMPYMYILVTFRNRLDNLARLVTSINNATTLQQRACMCIQVVDFNTDTNAIPAWKNKQCMATMHATFNMYMDRDDDAMNHTLSPHDIATSAQPPPCRDKPWGKPTPQPERVRRSKRMYGTSNGTLTHGFTLPLHVDVTGLTGIQAVRHVLSFFDGESTVIDGLAYMNDSRVSFSRAGGIRAGIKSITTPGSRSLVFFCDADMILRPGFFEDMLRLPVRGQAVYYPVCWSTCYGFPFASVPNTNKNYVPPRHMGHRPNRGYWRESGTGMVAAYMSDLHAVGALRILAGQRKWGGEDTILFGRFYRYHYRVERRQAKELVHMYHSRFKDWTASVDGMTGQGGATYGALVKHLCNPGRYCNCPNGTTAGEVAKQIRQTVGKRVQIWARRLRGDVVGNELQTIPAPPPQGRWAESTPPVVTHSPNSSADDGDEYLLDLAAAHAQLGSAAKAMEEAASDSDFHNDEAYAGTDGW